MNTGIVFKVLVVVALALGACVLMSGGALAAEGHDSGGELKDLMYRFINFALLVIVLVLAFKKASVKDFFAARREGIAARLESLKKQKEAAEMRCRELEAELAAFESERAAILHRFRAEGEAERDRIIAEANEKADQILLQADMTIKREVKNAEARLRSELADSVAARAQELVAGAITEKDQDFLVDEFIKKVERLH
jgi:F-type H+-transporting ATPase subunit b